MNLNLKKKIILRKRKFYQQFPALFFKDVLGVVDIENYQEEVLACVAISKRIAVSACHDVGKSFLMARVVLWYLYCFPNSVIITTAPTFNQVQNILWAELREAHSNARIPLGGKLNLTELRLDDKWYALGFTPKNEVSAGEGQGKQSSFQGFHAKYVLVIFDEATGIPSQIWKMAEGLLTSANVKFIVIGNPTTTNSEFYKCFSSYEWAKLYISCFDSPNLIANGITDIPSLLKEVEYVRSLPDAERLKRLQSYKVVKPYLLSTDWVVGRVLKWGINHPLTMGKVLGKFPTENPDALFNLHDIEEAQRREPEVQEHDRVSIGLDVARFGGDESIFTVLHGKKFLERKAESKRDLYTLSGIAMHMIRKYTADIIVIDETGMGGGVVDNVKHAITEANELGEDILCEVRGVQFGSKAAGEDTPKSEVKEINEEYTNIKTRMFQLLSDDIRNGLQVGLDECYTEELPLIQYDYNAKGQMFILSKKDFKKKYGGKSPDNADSLALANFGRYDEISHSSFTDVFTQSAPTMAGPFQEN